MEVALRDGTVVRLRPVRDGDEPGLRALLDRLSPESRRLRFFDPGPDLDRKAGWAASQGGGRGFGLVATVGSPERIVGHAAYVREDDGRAEAAIEVAEDMQDRGIGTALVRRLTAEAARAGIPTLKAIVHPDNHRMADLLRDCGLAVSESRGPRELVFLLPTSAQVKMISPPEASA
jgi:RimJ/RimL family protein N-acetyltransferase